MSQINRVLRVTGENSALHRAGCARRRCHVLDRQHEQTPTSLIGDGVLQIDGNSTHRHTFLAEQGHGDFPNVRDLRRQNRAYRGIETILSHAAAWKTAAWKTAWKSGAELRATIPTRFYLEIFTARIAGSAITAVTAISSAVTAPTATAATAASLCIVAETQSQAQKSGVTISVEVHGRGEIEARAFLEIARNEFQNWRSLIIDAS